MSPQPAKTKYKATITTTGKEVDVWSGPSYTTAEIRENVANVYSVRPTDVTLRRVDS